MLYELDNLKKQYGDRTVLNISSLSLSARKVYALIGPNGAGKTTLLNHLAFLDQPTSGVLKFRNKAVNSDKRHLVHLRRRVVLVDQSPILFSGTVWKNVEFGLKVRGDSKKECALKIPAALERVGMLNFANTDIHGLSGGEVKRVALARALVVEPEVLLCDEPTANVDQENQEVILKILEHANSMQNRSVIFSTHYLSQSRRLAHHTILLQNGEISFENNENTFDVTIKEERVGWKRLYLSSYDNLLFGEIQTSRLSEGTSRIHINSHNVILHAPESSEDRKSSYGSGIVKKIGIENNAVRLVIDMGVALTVSMSISRYRQNPPLVGQRVGVEIPEKAIVVP
jgi:tungstate transport system ATP-binding protein